MLRIVLLTGLRRKRLSCRFLARLSQGFVRFHHILQGSCSFLAILHGVSLAEHAVFIGFYSFS
jgi:hypothetical protein